MQCYCRLDMVFILVGIYTEAESRDAEPCVMVELSAPAERRGGWI